MRGFAMSLQYFVCFDYTLNFAVNMIYTCAFFTFGGNSFRMQFSRNQLRYHTCYFQAIEGNINGHRHISDQYRCFDT